MINNSDTGHDTLRKGAQYANTDALRQDSTALILQTYNKDDQKIPQLQHDTARHTNCY